MLCNFHTVVVFTKDYWLEKSPEGFSRFSKAFGWKLLVSDVLNDAFISCFDILSLGNLSYNNLSNRMIYNINFTAPNNQLIFKTLLAISGVFIQIVISFGVVGYDSDYAPGPFLCGGD